MIVTRDSTALMAMRTEASTGRPTVIKLLAASEVGASPWPAIRPATRNTRTGITIVPIAPSGSRRKILISIQVNFHSPRSIVIKASVANRVTGQFEKDVLQVGENGAEIRDPDAILRQTMNHLGDEIVAVTPDGELRVAANDRLDSRNISKTFRSSSIVCGEHDGSFGAVPIHEACRLVDVDDPSVFDDCYPVAQPLGLLHKMCGQENRLAALADAAHQVPDGAPRLLGKSRCQLVEKHHFRVVDQRKRNEQSLLLAPRQGHEPGVPLVGEAKLFEQPFTLARFPAVKRSPEVHRFPHFDPLLQLCLLELDANPLLQLVNVAEGIKAQYRDGAPVGRAQTLDALHRGGLSCAVRPD